MFFPDFRYLLLFVTFFSGFLPVRFDLHPFFLYTNSNKMLILFFHDKQTTGRKDFMMQTEQFSKEQIQAEQIQKEKRAISKCAGLLLGRSLLLVLLFFTIPFLAPAGFYLFLFFLLFPWILFNVLESHIKQVPPVSLNSCAKKFFYKPARYRAEKITNNLIVFFLLVWQIARNQSDAGSVLHALAPILLLLCYLLCTIIGTAVTRRKIHQHYMDFLSQ